MHINQGHGHAGRFDIVKQEHHAVADLKLGNFVVFEDVLEVVSCEGPDAVGILRRMLRDDFGVQFVKLDKVRPSQTKILK